MDCWQQILRGPEYLWIVGLVIDFPSQQVASGAFWSLEVWSTCCHSSAPYWSFVEACDHVLMDMTFESRGHCSVSLILSCPRGMDADFISGWT